MNFQSRKRFILAQLDQQATVAIHDLAEQLQTSEMTVRRDLTQLASEGLIYRTHGGAMRVDLVQQPFRFEHKAASRAEQKDHICQLAAQEIQEGETIFLDCGSTLFRLCPYIKNKRIQVITNSLPVVGELLGTSVHLNLIGGEVDAERQAIHGLIAEQHIRQYRADRAFIGVDGLSVASGLSANGEKEASMALALARQARVTYLLCDSSKFEQDKYLQFAPLSLVHTLITDPDAKPDQLDAYRQTGLRVLC